MFKISTLERPVTQLEEVFFFRKTNYSHVI